MTSQAPISELDAWRLKCLIAGGAPLADLSTLESDLARQLYSAVVSANGTGPDAALKAALVGNPDETAIRDAVAKADPNVPPSNSASNSPGRYTLHTASEALDAPEAPAWVVNDLLAESSLSMFAGAPGSKKTWTALDLAVCVALGSPWLNRAVKQGPVLIVDEESGNRRMKIRLAQAMKGHNAGRDLSIYYTTLAAFDLREGIKAPDFVELRSLIGTIQPVLIVVDALADIMPGADENTVRDVQPVVLALRQLSDPCNAAVVVLHHTTKAGGYRGSTAIAGAVDLLLAISSEPGSSVVSFKSEKARDVEPFSFQATAEFDLLGDWFRLETATAPAAPTYTKAESYVISFLRREGPSLFTTIKRKADQCSQSSARDAVYELVKRGVVRRCDPGGPGSKATYELAKP